VPCGTELAGTLLAIFLGVIKPTSENRERLRFDFLEGQAAAEIGLDVNDFGFGMKEFFASEDFDEHERVLRKRIHHVQVAAVKAQLADASRDAHVRFLLDELGAGDKGIPGRAALFSLQEDSLLKS
jgi:hypothetical protein